MAELVWEDPRKDAVGGYREEALEEAYVVVPVADGGVGDFRPAAVVEVDMASVEGEEVTTGGGEWEGMQ